MNRLEIVKEHIDALLRREDPVIVAIDGHCTAGKTTLASQLAESFDCNLFHMDDFFLRPEQRTEARYGEIGGNVDYERFQAEVLLPLKTGEAFSYRPFDCKTFTLSAPVPVQPKRINLIEGSYSHHPYFGDLYDLKVFLSITPELQHQRVLHRPSFLHQPFFEKWIPMENRYFEAMKIAEKSDVML